MSENHNLYCALRAAFPADLDACAIEAEPPDGGAALQHSWRDLEQASARMANLLAALGLPAGSRIAVQVDKSVDALVLYLATLRAGHVFLPLNPAYRSAELEYFIGDAQPALLVCRPQDFGQLSRLAFCRGVRHVFTLGGAHGASLPERAAHHGDGQQPALRQSDDLAAIIYTSGTTGRSKGAMLTHRNLLSNALVLRDYWGWQPGDVLLHALPIFHVHGLFVAIHGALLNSSRMIWHAQFDAAAVLAALPRATVFMGVPTMYVRLLAQAGLNRAALRGMRLFVSGSAPLLPATFDAWRERSGHTIVERYGMSETLMLSSNPWRADARHAGQCERRAGSAGFALPGVDLRVVDDAGQPLPVGTVGAIEVRGPGVFKGYWGMPEKTAEEFRPDAQGGAPWFKTGDLGSVDARGYLTLAGRSKDLIISGGLNVYPAEVEDCLNALPGVAESALIGVAHPDFGEAGVAIVTAKPGAQLDAQALLAALKTQLANFKIPKRCFIASELPRNAMGKVQKNLLREQYRDLFA